MLALWGGLARTAWMDVGLFFQVGKLFGEPESADCGDTYTVQEKRNSYSVVRNFFSLFVLFNLFCDRWEETRCSSFDAGGVTQPSCAR
jgi:hypothetical protein